MMAERVTKHAGGRPLKFQSIKEMQSKIDAYFDSCFEINEDGKKMQVETFTITGLALSLDTSRETLMDIENCNGKYSIDFSDAILRAKLRCHNYAEKQLYQAKSPQGAIFALKNYGWKDIQTVENTGPNGGPLQINTIASMSEQDLRAILEIYERAALPEVVDITPGDE